MELVIGKVAQQGDKSEKNDQTERDERRKEETEMGRHTHGKKHP